MTGKEKCEQLRRLRRTVAENNGIEYNPEECTYEGDCKGYCKKCDDEARYIEEELKRREKITPLPSSDDEPHDGAEGSEEEPLMGDILPDDALFSFDGNDL